jgi:thymidylate synthase ThyX
MSISQIKQSVVPLYNLSEDILLENMGTVLATPYGKSSYSPVKTKAVISTCMLQGHTSVLEHCYASLKCTTNIDTYKDFTRHRHCAFTIESTAFKPYTADWEVITVDPLTDKQLKALDELRKVYLEVKDLRKARDFIPQSCAATMCITTNFLEWRHIIGVRGDVRRENPLTFELRNKIWWALNINYPFFFPIAENTKENPMCIYDTWGSKAPAVCF